MIRRLRGIGWGLASVSALVGTSFALDVPRDRTLRESVPQLEMRTTATVPQASPDSLWVTAPFRIGRVMPSVRYSPDVPSSEPDSSAAPGRPEWRLTGIVRGRELIALFEGIPGAGATTRLVRRGEEVGGYVIEFIGADSVLVAGSAGQWVYRLEVPWG